MIKSRLLLLLLLLVLFSNITGCQLDESAKLPRAQVERPQTTAPPQTPMLEVTAGSPPLPNPTVTQEVDPTTQIPTPKQDSSPAAIPTNLPTAIPTETPIPTNPVLSISLVPIIEGAFIQPLYLTHAGDNRLFIVEQAGIIRIIEDGNLLDAPFLDIRERVGSTQLEQGLLGLAFHPNYAESRVFFVNYTNLAGDTNISRFTVDSDDPYRANPNSEAILLSYEQPFPNHNGGQVAFGPDGYLYIGVGDGGSANDPLNNGQDPETFLGTILRLDVNQSADSYTIPGTNPFVDDPTRLDEIWAWGLRNPWRFSFDRLTGDLFIADVGQNLWEEIHFQPAESSGGENYGWNIFEGSHCFLGEPCDFTGLEMPIFEYSHQEGCSITGGYMYRGLEDLELYGNYFLADFCQGTIWRLIPDESGNWASEIVHDSNYVISSFGEDSAGELYVLDHTGGSLYKIKP